MDKELRNGIVIMLVTLVIVAALGVAIRFIILRQTIPSVPAIPAGAVFVVNALLFRLVLGPAQVAYN